MGKPEYAGRFRQTLVHYTMPYGETHEAFMLQFAAAESVRLQYCPFFICFKRIYEKFDCENKRRPCKTVLFDKKSRKGIAHPSYAMLL
jgi:hypothetical protein